MIDKNICGMRIFFYILAAGLFFNAALCVRGEAAVRTNQTAPEANPDAETARRDAILVQAIKDVYTPPEAGVIPKSSDIPLAGAWEDPDWDTPLVQSFYKNPYSYGNSLDSYLPCLEEALRGNPKAMLALAMLYFLWGHTIEDMYPNFPAQAHASEYWIKWAEEIAGSAWVKLRLGDLHRRWPNASADYYKEAAFLGNAEAMFNYYLTDPGQLSYLYRSAAMGHPRAAFVLGENIEKQGNPEDMDMSRRFTWLSAINGDEWGLLRSSIAFYNSEFGPNVGSCEQGYLYAMLALRYNQGYQLTGQYPENNCMLSPQQIAELELAADEWQAELDQRRLPMVLRSRYRREDIVKTMQDELAPLMNILNMRAQTGDPGSFGQPNALEQTERVNAMKRQLPWHLGFFDEHGTWGVSAYENAQGDMGVYAQRQYGAYNRHLLPFAYDFVLVVISLAIGMIYYGHWRKKRRRAASRIPRGSLATVKTPR